MSTPADARPPSAPPPSAPSPSALPDDVAQRVELSERDAYAAFAEAAQAAGHDDLLTLRRGNALALALPAARGTLVLNRVLCLGLTTAQEQTAEGATDGAASEADLDALADFYRAHRLPWGLEYGPAQQPAALKDWLRQRRIRRTQASTLLIRRCDTPLPAPASDCTLTIRRWQPEDADAGARLAADVFGLPEPFIPLLASLNRHPRWRQWLALEDGRVVATSLLYLGDDMAWIGWGATLDGYRGRGIHPALLAARLQDAAAHGCRWLSSETASGTPAQPDPSLRNLVRMGFTPVHQRHTHVCVGG